MAATYWLWFIQDKSASPCTAIFPLRYNLLDPAFFLLIAVGLVLIYVRILRIAWRHHVKIQAEAANVGGVNLHQLGARAATSSGAQTLDGKCSEATSTTAARDQRPAAAAAAAGDAAPKSTDEQQPQTTAQLSRAADAG